MITLAHVKWFVDSEIASQSALDLAEWLIVSAIVATGLMALLFINRFIDRSGVSSYLNKQLKFLQSYVPMIVRMSTGLFLLVNVYYGHFLAANLTYQGGFLQEVITVIFIVTAGLFILGSYTKIAAGLLLSGYVLSGFEFGFVEIIDHLEYAGIAGYLWYMGPGALSLQQSTIRVENSVKEKAYDIYRVFLGLGLAVLGLSEKLIGVSLANDFLLQHNWNFLSGFGVTDRYFIIIAGSMELLIGIGLILKLAPRLLIIGVLGLMLLTAALLGIEEVFGHLFALGAAAVLLTYKPITKRSS